MLHCDCEFRSGLNGPHGQTPKSVDLPIPDEIAATRIGSSVPQTDIGVEKRIIANPRTNGGVRRGADDDARKLAWDQTRSKFRLMLSGRHRRCDRVRSLREDFRDRTQRPFFRRMTTGRGPVRFLIPQNFEGSIHRRTGISNGGMYKATGGDKLRTSEWITS
jgi:hypothetical protein